MNLRGWGTCPTCLYPPDIRHRLSLNRGPGETRRGWLAFAHSANGAGKWQALEDHLRGVADLCRAFASSFGAGDLGWYIGLWHDIGKFDPTFQAYLHRPRGRGPDHKAAGCRVAVERGLGLAALVIQGHHGGLRSPTDFEAWFGAKSRSKGVEEALAQGRHLSGTDGMMDSSRLPEHVLHDPLSAELFLRFLFSALVDADFLDTERHFDPAHAEARGSDVALETLQKRLQMSQEALPVPPGPVGDARRSIHRDCLDAAEGPAGVYRLTAPTGSGKTLSGMAFALQHAIIQGQTRVIVALPFTAITEQSASVYRSIFDVEPGRRSAVLEHHSSIDDGMAEENEFDSSIEWSRLAAENWDAPVIVTTTVQLFESLFGSRTSTSRKLHRIANSVLILDEAQALPPHLLDPILNASAELARRYNTTIVLSTATQPAFDALEAFSGVPLTEIVREPARHFQSLQRVDYQWDTDRPASWAEVASQIHDENHVLVVVNTKSAALKLLAALDDLDALHLSTLLCAAHRRDVVEDVRRRLQSRAPCRLIATQVIEAGVDIDFPVVYREMGPLDSVIQAAGRCNREGKQDKGRVIVFEAADGSVPRGFYRAATDVTRGLAHGELDPNGYDAARTYYEKLYNTWDTDRERIQALRARFDFPEVSRRFRMITDATEDVVVRYGSAEEREWVDEQVTKLRLERGSPRILLRSLRPYLVSVRASTAESHRRSGLIADIMPGIAEWQGSYHPVTGLDASDLRPYELVI